MIPQAGILYEDQERRTVLIDIPLSITHAQGNARFIRDHILCSTSPLQRPYPVLNEPSSGKKISMNTVDEVYHYKIRDIIEASLNDIRLNHSGEWCVTRRWAQPPILATGKKRTAAGDEMSKPPSRLNVRVLGELHSSSNEVDEHEVGPDKILCLERGALTPPVSNSSLYNKAISSRCAEAVRLEVSSQDIQPSRRFWIPSRSTFIQSRIQDSILTFKSLMERDRLHLLDATKFHFILLDPPWPNASAKRAHSYDRPRTLRDTEQLLKSMRLEDHIAPSGYVGIWITNKKKIRDFVLGTDRSETAAEQQEWVETRRDQEEDASRSLFNQWGLTLAEEWVWVKTTIHGEPVTDLNSAWRKPYEILLLGQRETSLSDLKAGSKLREVKMRVIAGVPDLHSRKPSLKGLIEPFMPDTTCYRALEVFSRHLTADWWAWGDQVLRFNWEEAWLKKEHISEDLEKEKVDVIATEQVEKARIDENCDDLAMGVGPGGVVGRI